MSAARDSVYSTSDSRANCLARSPLGVVGRSNYSEKAANAFGYVLWGFGSRLVNSLSPSVFHYLDPIMLSESVNQSSENHFGQLDYCMNRGNTMTYFWPIINSLNCQYLVQKSAFNYLLLVP